MKKIITCAAIIAVIATLAGCGKKENPENTATATAAATATATSAAAETPEATPTPEPTPTPTPKQVVNVVPAADAVFDGIKSIDETSWKIMGKGTLSLVDGYEGKCLRYVPDLSDNQHYYTPLINIYPFIKEAGEYEVSFKFRSTASFPYVLIRGGTKDDINSFIEMKASGNPYYITQTASEADADNEEWTNATFTFNVEDSDIQAGVDHEWLVCFDHIDVANNQYIDIDNFVIEYLE